MSRTLYSGCQNSAQLHSSYSWLFFSLIHKYWCVATHLQCLSYENRVFHYSPLLLRCKNEDRGARKTVWKTCFEADWSNSYLYSQTILLSYVPSFSFTSQTFRMLVNNFVAKKIGWRKLKINSNFFQFCSKIYYFKRKNKDLSNANVKLFANNSRGRHLLVIHCKMLWAFFRCLTFNLSVFHSTHFYLMSCLFTIT